MVCPFELATNSWCKSGGNEYKFLCAFVAFYQSGLQWQFGTLVKKGQKDSVLVWTSCVRVLQTVV
jgi:hypothetical protein